MTTESREIVQRAYADDPGQYDQVRVHDPRGQLVSGHDVWVFNQLFPTDCASLSVVELGAGTGRFSVPALRTANHLVATDINESMLELLQDKLREHGCTDRCSTQVEDIFNLSFEDRSLDYVFAIHVIPRFRELEDQRQAIQEVARTLKPGGRFLFNFSNRSSLYGRLYNRHAATWGQMRQMLTEAGLRIETQRGKWLVNRTLINHLPLIAGRTVAAVDRALVRFWPSRAWDVFIVATREES